MSYEKDCKKIEEELGTDMKAGLNTDEVVSRLETYGYNVLKEKKKISPIQIFFDQFKSFIVLILVAATIISLIIGEVLDSIVILIILLINAGFGFIQEYRAEKSIEALKKLSSLKAKVMRDGKEVLLDSKELVPGDVILLSEGDKIPADARLFEVYNFETQESSLTGESTPVRKIIEAISDEKKVADRTNMIYSGTIVTKGEGKAIVTGTAMDTEIGKIAKIIQETKEQLTPLQLKLRELGKWLGIMTIGICIIVFVTGITIGKHDVFPMFMTAISLAVAAIPEGLPAVVTISLALGVRRMVKRNALVRKLPSVETLGCTNVICTDKTGTLTCNEMTVRELFVDNEVIEVTGQGYSPEGRFSKKKNDLELLLKIGLRCNNSSVDFEENVVIGDPTEAALKVSAAKYGIKEAGKKVDEIPFDSDRKMMTSVHEVGLKRVMYTKGAVDILIKRCDQVMIDGKRQRLTRDYVKKVLAQNDEFAGKALRVLGFAYKELKSSEKAEEKSLVFVGMQAMMDPPRSEVKDAIEKCRKAGIKVVMITGDHMVTAKAVAEQIGIEGRCISGNDLDKIKNLEKEVDDIGVYARVNPEDKIRIVTAFQKKGYVVAVSGDGVNDAPALKKADIGVAMGITGTDVAKESADMILLDDNFASIVNAVEEGRGIFDNIKKFVNYLLSSNLGEVLVIFVAGMLFQSLPLLAIQILWINLITDGLPALALGVDPIDPDIMSRKPRKKGKGIITKYLAWNIATIGIVICITTLVMFMIGRQTSIETARTMAFSTLVVLEIVRIQMIRHHYNVGVFSNKWLVMAVLASFGLQLIVLYTPLSNIFKTVSLTLMMWVQIIIAAVVMLIFGGIISKFVRRMTHEND